MEIDSSKWEKSTVQELREELKARGLVVTGVKANLIERLKISDKAQAELKAIESEEILVDEDVDEDGTFVDEDIADIEADEGDPINEEESLNEGEEEEDHAEGDAPENKESSLKEEDDEMPPEQNKGEFDEHEKGVLIETVGEVDDDEFGAAVAGLEEFEEHEEKTSEPHKESTVKKETDIKDLRPLPVKSMHNWMLQEFTASRDFCSLYIKPLSSKDVLGECMYEWANRAIYFCINHERNGKGVAVLNFLTEKECKEAKESLTQSLGGDVKISHPSRHKEGEMRKELSYKTHSTIPAESRLLIVEDVPENTSEDQICLLFPEAITISHPSAKQLKHTWHNEEYGLPEDINKKYFVEFSSLKQVADATGESKEYEIDGAKLTVHSFVGFEKAYKEYEMKKREEARKKRSEEMERSRKERLEKMKSKVMKDKVRIEKCKLLKEYEGKITEIEKNKELPSEERKKETEKLSEQIIKVIQELQQDTNYRKKLEMAVPEDKDLMTPHTKSTFKERPSRKDRHKDRHTDRNSDKKDRRRSDDKHDRNKHKSKSSRSPSKDSGKKYDLAKRELTKKDHNGIREEIEKMEEDIRGWWHLLIYKPDDPDFPQTESEMRTFCGKYGRVMQVHFNGKKIFVRFNSYKAVAAAVRDLWSTKLTVEVPRINDKYRKKKLDQPRGRRDRDVQMQQDFRPMDPFQEQMIKQQQQMLMQKQLEEQQLQQQQSMLQAAVQMQQMQAMNQVGILGNVPQPSLLGQPGGVMGIMNAGASASVPSLLGPGGVQPLMGGPSDSRDDRSHRSRRHSRSPERRSRFDRRRSNISPERPGLLDAKRSRMDDRSDRPNRNGDDVNEVQSLTQTINTQVEQISRLGGDPSALRSMLDSLGTIQNAMLPTPSAASQPSYSTINQSSYSTASSRPLLAIPPPRGIPAVSKAPVSVHHDTGLIQAGAVQGRIGMHAVGVVGTSGQKILFPGAGAMQGGIAVAGIQAGSVQGQFGGYGQPIQQQQGSKQPLLKAPFVHKDRLMAFREGRL